MSDVDDRSGESGESQWDDDDDDDDNYDSGEEEEEEDENGRLLLAAKVTSLCCRQFILQLNPSSCAVAQGLTWSLTEMSTRNISWGVKAAGM
jgi:hypothetical protein